MAAGQFYLCCRAWPCGCCMPGAVDSLATLTSLLLAVPTAVTLHSICRISPTWQGPASLLGQAGECTWLREPRPIPHTNKILWRQNETESVGNLCPFHFCRFLFLCNVFPLKCREALKGGAYTVQSSLLEMSVSMLGSQGSGPITRCAAAYVVCTMGSVYKGIISISGMRGQAQFIKTLPHTFPHSVLFCHLIKDSLTSRRKGDTVTLEGVDEAINQWFSAKRQREANTYR